MAGSQTGMLFREQVAEARRQRLYGEVVLTDSRISSKFVAVIAVVSVGLIIWAMTATYPRTETVPGVVVTTKPSAKVLAPRAGVAERVHVRENERVHQGQPLVFVGVEIRDEGHRGAANDTLTALDSQKDSVDVQIAAARSVMAAERDKLGLTLEAVAMEQRSIRVQMKIQASIVKSKTEELERIRPTVEKGYMSRLELDRREQSLLIEQQRLEQFNQQLVQLGVRRQDLEAQLERLPADERRQLAELEGQLSSISQQKSRTKVEVGYTVVAPIEGRVTALQASPGKGIEPGVPLMVILPEDPDFHVNLYAPSRAVGFIKVGQPVRVSYDAFPYKQFGTFGGEIDAISGMAYAPGELDTPIKVGEPVYAIKVRLANETATAFGRSLPLQSGMTLTGNIILERRSFLDWLLQPLNAVRKRT